MGTDTLLNIWEKAQSTIKERVGQSGYETWFSNLSVKEHGLDAIGIETPDEFFKNWIVDHYQGIIQDTINSLAGKHVQLSFSVNTQMLQAGGQSKIKEFEKPLETLDLQKSNINPRFTFDSFVIGPSNRFAHAACMAVAESPAKAYNPLFIYGGVGLGKTHLMQAIINRVHLNNPRIKSYYTTSEKFTNELIEAIRHRSTNQFRQKYRTIDVLLIDDIHFIAGKESTQEEFFHTFNALHESRKQIIISSDRPPKEIANLEERLTSRFAWGLITDIQAPDYETRVAILRKKIEREPVKVPDDVIYFIAEEIKSNIRELEGALIRVVAYSLLEEKPVSLEIAKLVLKDMVKETLKIINVDLIQKSVAEFFQINQGELKNSRRHKNIVLPRQIAMYLTRQLTNLSLPEIGHAFGGKDHTTVLHSYNKIELNLKTDLELKNIIEKLSTVIKR